VKENILCDAKISERKREIWVFAEFKRPLFVRFQKETVSRNIRKIELNNLR